MIPELLVNHIGDPGLFHPLTIRGMSHQVVLVKPPVISSLLHYVDQVHGWRVALGDAIRLVYTSSWDLGHR